MPRIDPLQLLKCLSVLLSPEGGILSQEEVPRLVNLMTKFSKKLVSKCVYILILKSTETRLVDMFMGEGGWALIQTWLQDAAHCGNWDLVKETLELLLVTPVDVERLKMNSLPKLIKTLSRREDLEGVAQLSNKIVQNWLVIVKQSGQNAASAQNIKESISNGVTQNQNDQNNENTNNAGIRLASDDENLKDEVDAISTGSFYKLSVRDGKQVIQKVEEESLEKAESKEEDKKSEKKESTSSSSSSKHSSSKDKKSKSSHSSSSSSKDKDRDKDKKRSSSSSSSSKSRDDKRSSNSKRESSSKDKSKSSSSSSSSRHKDRDKDKDKDKKSSSSKDKEKQSEKDKDTLSKLKPQSLEKLGKIPKKSDSEKDKSKPKKDELPEKKKPSFSILDRKSTGEERSKTVKIFNSKMRSTGLEQEAKPPPPRQASKKVVPPPVVVPVKRPSPPREDSIVPPEKKIKMDKIDVPERPGAIKLIPPKPKPAFLQESDIFMDALTASATTKKEPKKRKRRPSTSKENEASSPPTETPTTTMPTTPATPTSPTTAPAFSAPINFYQDTLSEQDPPKDAESNKENLNESLVEESEAPGTPTDPAGGEENIDAVVEEEDITPPTTVNADGLRGVLLHSKKRGPKRGIQWRPEESLVEVRYFELDETERINVTRNFNDMAKMEMSSEREALQLSRKVGSEDMMGIQTMWRIPPLCEQPDPLAQPGSKSLEKDIQFAREKATLPAPIYHHRRAPDTPDEPDHENHPMSDPVAIPLEDPDSQEIDLRGTPWPEPKGSPPEPAIVIPPPVPIQTQFVPPQNGMMPPAAIAAAFQQQRLQQMQAPGRFGVPHPGFAPPGFQPPPDHMGGAMGGPMFVPQTMPPEGFDAFGPPGGGFAPVQQQGGFQGRQGPPGRGGGPPGPFRRGGGWVRMNSGGGGNGGGGWKRMGGVVGEGGFVRMCRTTGTAGIETIAVLYIRRVGMGSE